MRGRGRLLNVWRGDTITEEAECYAFSPVVGIGTPPTPHPQASVPSPPLVPGGGAHSLAREGVGESQFRRGDIHCGTLYIYVICGQNGPHSWCDRGWGGPQMYNHILPYPCHIQVFLFHTHKAVRHQSFNYLIQYPPPSPLLPIYLMTLHV